MRVRQNVIANYVGQAWSAVMGLAFVPVYLRYLGVEAYGLIGMVVLLQTLLGLLDLGLTPALSRELSRFQAGARDSEFIRDLVRSVEAISIVIALAIAGGVWAASGWIGTRWVQGERLAATEITQAFAIMGFVIALRFVENIYRSGLMGLQRQISLNVVTSLAATVRSVGAVGVLAWLSPTISAFFVWHGVVSALTTLVMLLVFYRALPAAPRSPRFSIEALRDIWKFAGGMLCLAVLSLLLTQLDKLMLSKLVNLEQFGHYALAATAANLLYMVVTPISQAYFPHFSALLVRKDSEGLGRSYHQAAQCVTVIAGSLAFLLIGFGHEVLLVWTRDAQLAERVAPIVSALALGTFLNGLLWIPHQMQLAHGITNLAVRTNVVAIVIVAPALWWVTPRYGPLGAAWVWVALNVGYMLFNANLMYHRILAGERRAWFIEDIGVPVIALALATALCRWGLPGATSLPAASATLAAAACVFVAAGVLTAPAIRSGVMNAWSTTPRRTT